jgi:hypothetical protein
MLEAAIDIAQCSGGFYDYGASCTGFDDAEHASRGPVDHDPAAGFVWHHDATTGRFEHASEVIIS